MKLSIKKLDIIIITVLILITLFRVGLTLRNPTLIWPNQGCDDNLLYEYANNLIHGEWLGDYTENTMAKRISYPLFIAFCYEFLIPYSFGLALLNIVAAIFICIALKPKVHKIYLYILYALILFSPVGFTTLISQRTYRNSILPYSVLLVFAGFIGLYLRRKENFKKLIPWSILTSISLVFFWNVKEDSIWILPFILVISILAIINLFIYNKKNIVLKSFLFAIPFACIIITNLILSTINYCVYGIFTTSDKSGCEFGKMMTKLYSIEDNNKPSVVWISRKMIEKACEASPTLSQLKEDLLNDEAWLEDEGDLIGEVKGDYYVWRMRYLMSKHDYYENAQKANSFCKKVNDELDIAFKNGSLPKDHKIHIVSQMKGLDLQEIFSLVPASIDQMIYVGTYKDCELDLNSTNAGDQYAIDYINSILGVRTRNFHDNKDISHREEKISNTINKVYSTLSIPTFLIAIIGYTVYTIFTLLDIFKKDYEKLNLWWIITGVILSAFIACLEVMLFTSFFDKEMFDTYKGFYSAGIYPLMQLFKYLGIYLLISLFVSFIKSRKTCKD